MILDTVTALAVNTQGDIRVHTPASHEAQTRTICLSVTQQKPKQRKELFDLGCDVLKPTDLNTRWTQRGAVWRYEKKKVSIGLLPAHRSDGS